MIAIEYNRKFIEALGADFFAEAIITEKLFDSSIIDADIVCYEGGYFFDFQKPIGKLSNDLMDITGNEAFYNKIQVVDYISTELDIKATILQSVKYSMLLSSKLSSLGHRSFSVLLTFDESFESVTFYGNRSGENYLNQDLEKMFDPTLIIKTT